MPIPCLDAVGVVVHIARDEHGIVKQYVVNFGEYFGVQIIEAYDYKEVLPHFVTDPLPPWVEPILDSMTEEGLGIAEGQGRGRGQGRAVLEQCRGLQDAVAARTEAASTQAEQAANVCAANGPLNPEGRQTRGRGGRPGGRGRGPGS